MKNDKFFVTIMDPPMKGDQTSLDYYKAQLTIKIVEPLRDKLGVDVSEEAMRKGRRRTSTSSATWSPR